MTRALIALLLAFALASCASRPKEAAKPAAAAPAPTQVQAGTSFGNFMTYQGPIGAPAPAMETGRKVNEQDCTQGIDFNAGNLRCR
jgi:PBP1b-binding outer membrane lipoprotein LpoB